MLKFASILAQICRWITGFAFIVLMSAVIIQVLGRSVFNDSPVWTEELTRFALLYIAAFGACLSYRTGELVNVDLISNALPGRMPIYLRCLSALLTVFLCAMLIAPGLLYTSIGARQTSSALILRMDFVHVTVLILPGLLLIFALARAYAIIRGQSNGLPEDTLEEM